MGTGYIQAQKKLAEKKKQTVATEAEIKAAYKEVLGRSADKGGLENYKKAGLTVDQLKKDLAGSVEAGRRGVDATKYGVKAADPNSLNERQRVS